MEKIEITEQLDQILKLQEVDSQLYELKRQKELKPQELNAIKEELVLQEAQAKKAEDDSRAFLLKRKEKELELETRELNIKKLQTQQFQVKTNKEYSAMQQEIEGLRADKSVLEEEVIVLFDKIDAAKTEVEKQKQLLQQQKNKFQSEEKRIHSEIADIEKGLAELEAKRTTITPLIKHLLLANYERILKGKSGLAMAEVRGDACGGCFINLPPQVINEIKMKDKIIYCENCSRILYIKE